MDATIGEPRASSSVEREFEAQPRRGARGQLTPRAMAAALVLGVAFCFVALQIHMTAGIVPALNMPINVISFFSVKWITSLLEWCGVACAPFTRQENIVLVTTITTALNMALAGGFATYIIGMSSAVAKSLVDDPDPRDIVDHVQLGHWMLFLFLVGLMAILCSMPLNQVMIVDYKLLFPTGSVQAHLINGFHTPRGAYIAKLHIATIFRTFIGSFFWASFQWFYSAGKDCGFQYFPTFGLELYKHRFYFDFSPTFVGLGMLCPHIVNFGLLGGAIISWGFLYPFLDSKKGQWYHTDSTTSLKGSNGYKVFMSIAIIVSDGLFNLITLMATSSIDINSKRKEDSGLANYMKKHPSLNYDDRKRIEVFIGEGIPVSIPIAGYIICGTICTIFIPWFFNQIKFYHVATLYIVIPVFAFCNTYGTGLTDWSVAPTYSKFTIFIVALWIAKPGAVIASLVACGIIMAGLHVSSQATQDMKSGFMTLTSPRAMAIAQIFGVLIGSIVNPCIFHAIQRSTAEANVSIGSIHSEYPCPYSGLYRAIGVIGMGGVKELPDHCVAFCWAAFCITAAIKSLTLVSQRRGWKIHNYIPSMTVVALPFFAGSYFTIDMSLGSVLLIIWTKLNSRGAELLATAVAAGLICGEGLFTLPSVILTMFNVQPPMCMKFLPGGKEVTVVDSFLDNLRTPTGA